MESAIATLDWHLWIHCPECDETIDLSESPHDDEGCFSLPIFNNNWEQTKGEKVYCPECKCKFEVKDIEL